MVRNHEERFRELADQWKRERDHYSSSTTTIASHPAYQEIIRIGKEAVPLIIAELKKHPDHWFTALHQITGAGPVPEESRGNLKEIAKAWIEWYENVIFKNYPSNQ